MQRDLHDSVFRLPSRMGLDPVHQLRRQLGERPIVFSPGGVPLSPTCDECHG